MGRFDMSKLRAAVRKSAAETHRNKDKVMKGAAKGFVRTMILITPPGSRDRAGLAAKAVGEYAIQADVLKLAYAATAMGRGSKKALATPAQLLAAHTAARRNGRVSQAAAGKARLLMAIADINRVIAQLQLGVGFLAGGWNKAAAWLGVPVPGWIKRHGTSAGIVNVTATSSRFRLEISNAVPFVGSVGDLDQRMTRAMNVEIGNIRRQSAALVAQSHRSAGFK